MKGPTAIELRLRTTSRVLQVTFDDGRVFELPFEYLRVHSPSAEVKGHGPGQEVLVTGKAGVGIRAIETGGHTPSTGFDEDTPGLFTWKYLYELGRDYAQTWARYQARVASATAEQAAGHKKGPGF